MREIVNSWEILYRDENDADLQGHIDRLRQQLKSETIGAWKELIGRFLDAALCEQEERVNRQLLQWSTKGGSEVSCQ